MALQYVLYLLLRMVAACVNSLPPRAADAVAARFGDLACLLLAKRREVCLENLNIVFGDRKNHADKAELARQTFRHVAISLFELFRMPKFAKGAKENVVIGGAEHLKKAFEPGKGAILAMSHVGPWEYLQFLPLLTETPCTILGKRVRNPFMYKWIKSLRHQVGLNHCDKEGGAKVILSELKKNRLVAIAVDQWAGNDELWIDFFGRPASTTTLPARLALKTGAPIVPAYCVRTGSGHYKAVAFPEIPIPAQSNDPVKEMTCEINRLFEKIILKHPDQWLWTHHRWKGKKVYA